MDERLQLSPETSRIEQLTDDVLLLILSFLPTLAEIARTSILNRRWRNLWHNVTCLDFDATALLPRERWEESRAWFTERVNKVIDARIAMPELPKVKDLRIRCRLDEKQARHIDRWIDFAVSNQVETLHLDFAPYTEIILHRREYTLLKETWYRAPSGLCNIKCLKSLVLSCVNVSKQFIEFILSSCLLLEDLSWCYAGIDTDLDVSGVPPLRLRRLKIAVAEGFALTKLCAPYLTSLYYDSTKLSPQKIDVPMLTDLTIGSSTLGMRPLMKYLEHFWSYLPQLEKLYLIISDVCFTGLISMPLS
ncbi:unnamed protein product [Rhodiola kirilowii]